MVLYVCNLSNDDGSSMIRDCLLVFVFCYSCFIIRDSLGLLIRSVSNIDHVLFTMH